MVAQYTPSRSNKPLENQAKWYDWTSYISLHRRKYFACIHPRLEVVVVSYDYGNSTRGLTRRESLRILKRAGLRPPLAMEVFRVATVEIQNRVLVGVIDRNNYRRIMCPVPINPEFPTFYCFGRGEGYGYFQKFNYATIDNKDPIQSDDIFFWEHQDGYMSVGPELGFPMLIGVRE
jgi:hypothetical protein